MELVAVITELISAGGVDHGVKAAEKHVGHLSRFLSHLIRTSRIYCCLADYTCMSEFNWNEEK